MTTVARVEREELLGAQARVERTLARWQRLQRELVAALEVEEAAERALLDRVHQLNLAGVEGKNAAERDAALHVATAGEREAVQVARAATRRMRWAAERAERTYDSARYRHRVWRILAARAAEVGGEDTW